MSKSLVAHAAIAAMLVVGLPAALAQTAPPPGLVGGPGFAGPGSVGPAGGAFPPFMMPPFLADRAPPSPKEMCLEVSAMRVGYFAYLRQRLDLTPAQVPLWHDVEAAVGETANAARSDCAALPATPDKPALSAALSFADKHLIARRQGLLRIGTPLLKLYEGLSPEQREILDRSLPPPMIL